MPGPHHAADPGQARAAMGDERVDQRPGVVAGGGVDDEPRRLVDDDQVVVLVDHVERDRFPCRLGGLGRRHVDDDRFPPV